MAEQEIIKHTKNALGAAFAPERPVWHKVREIAGEVTIIVFAVTLSMWLHGVGEHRHEQQQVKTFLLGLKGDLQSDIRQVREAIKVNQQNDADYRYLASLETAQAPDMDKFKAAYHALGSFHVFLPRSSRYEGFKSSGKLINIENPALLDNILTVYQQLVPEIHLNETEARAAQRDLAAYVQGGIVDGTGRERFHLLAAPRGRFLSSSMQTPKELYERYRQVIDLDQRIITDIDAAYPGEHGGAG